MFPINAGVDWHVLTTSTILEYIPTEIRKDKKENIEWKSIKSINVGMRKNKAKHIHTHQLYIITIIPQKPDSIILILGVPHVFPYLYFHQCLI